MARSSHIFQKLTGTFRNSGHKINKPFSKRAIQKNCGCAGRKHIARPTPQELWGAVATSTVIKGKY